VHINRLEEMTELEVTYFDPKLPGSLGGVDKLYRSQKHATREEVRDFLKGEDAYTLHKPVRYRFKRNKVVVSGIDFQWDADLMILSAQKASNDGFQYVLVATDILSHYAWTRPLKTKSGKEVSMAFQSIFQEGRTPDVLRTDKGSEFRNPQVSKVTHDAKVKHFVTQNEVKANYAERLIRTLKMKMNRYFTKKQTHRWVDILNDITDSYNHTYHRTIKRTPISVNHENESEVWKTQYHVSPPKPDGAFKFKLGSYVRISHIRHTFQREYDERYTGEMFKVQSRRRRNGLNIYALEDINGEDITGSFYEPELQEIRADPNGIFKIEKILRSRKRRGKAKEYLVRWMHWPPKFDSWVKASDLQDI